MGYAKEVYDADVTIDSIEYFKIGTVAKIVDKSIQTIRLWEKYSDTLEENNEPRLIPKSVRVGKNNVRYWTSEDIDLIVEFSKKLKYGDIAEFSRGQWGKRADFLIQDKSTKARKEKAEYRKKVNKLGKKLANQKKVLQIKSLRADMLATVRSRARHIYDDTYK